MDNQLSVQWNGGVPINDKPVARGIHRLIRDEFRRHNLIGIWLIKPIKLVGTNSAPLDLRRKHVDEVSGYTTLRFFVRPFGRESCWEVSIAPPDGVDIDEIVELFRGDTKIGVGAATAEDSRAELAVGKIFRGTVTKVLQYGLSLMLEGHDAVGLLPLEEISPDYDVEVLKKFPVRSKLKVMLQSIDGNKLRFSKIMAEAMTSERATDVYAGVPDRDGMLRLKGFSESLSRRVQMLSWIGEVACRFDPEPAPKAEVISHIRAQLMVQTGASEVEAKAIGTIANKFEAVEWITVQRDADGIATSYTMTQFGWSELGGIEKVRAGQKVVVEHPINVRESDAPPEIPPVDGVETPPETEYGPGTEGDPEEPTGVVTIPGPHQITSSMPQSPLAEYFVKMNDLAGVLGRIQELQAEMLALEAQKNTLEGWIREHGEDLQKIVYNIPKG